MRRFLLIFAILFLAPIIGHAATCTSTETVTKCAKIPTKIYVEYESTLSDPCTFIYKDVVYSGNKPILSGTKSTCTINSPLNANVDGRWEPGSYGGTTFIWSSFSFTSKLDGDICPDGFYTVPYNVSCGAGMVDTANVPNCSDDTSGESCLIPATSAPAPEYKFTATIDLSLYDDNQMGFEPVTEFGFDLGASGTFYVDWGDGTTETIKKDNTDAVTYTHDYGTTSGTYTVKIGGLATDYSDDEDTPAISFGVDVASVSAYPQAITEISGSLGAIFPTLSDGSQPRFPFLFDRAKITAIPSGLFDGIHGAPVSNMFVEAFGGCYNLTSIPENLFAGITGNAPYMFSYTFTECYNLTSIPENLFSGITGAAEGMFADTFFACYSLADIPETLFSGVTGNAPYMFSNTFAVCEGMTSIPENLFSGITGAAEDMFATTFMGCTGITNIPEKLFAGVTGSAPNLFNSTFDSCFSLTGIPENLFSGITGAADGMFEYTFQGCSMLTGPSARINGQPLYELWPDNIAEWGNSMYYDSTGLDDYACIPTVMGGGGEECATEPEYKFSITISSSFNEKISWGFAIAAAGTFYVDWGDGNTEKIEKTDTQYKAYIHYYTFDDSHQSYTIRIGGVATAYSDDNSSTIDFSYEAGRFITEINGSLGAVFPTLPDGSQPSFSNCFRNAKITEIPAELFDGIYGVPKKGMFSSTFNTNEKLVSIPETLFSGITGASESVFAYTFHGCYALKSIPENLFSGITGNAPDMFYGTFAYCSNLTGPSARINGKYLYELWDEDPKMWGWDMYTDATGLDDYAYIPVIMGGLGQSREQLCTIGISQIKTSTGLAFALYAEKYTQPSMAIKYNNGICYGKLEQGNQSGTINVNYNGVVYHLIN